MAGKSRASSATFSLQLKIFSALGFLPKVILKYIVDVRLQKKKSGAGVKALRNEKITRLLAGQTLKSLWANRHQNPLFRYIHRHTCSHLVPV